MSCRLSWKNNKTLTYVLYYYLDVNESRTLSKIDSYYEIVFVFFKVITLALSAKRMAPHLSKSLQKFGSHQQMYLLQIYTYRYTITHTDTVHLSGFYVIMQQCVVISQFRSCSIILIVTFNFMLRSQAKISIMCNLYFYEWNRNSRCSNVRNDTLEDLNIIICLSYN